MRELNNTKIIAVDHGYGKAYIETPNSIGSIGEPGEFSIISRV